MRTRQPATPTGRDVAPEAASHDRRESPARARGPDALESRLLDSPRLVDQRRRFDALFGSAAQPRDARGTAPGAADAAARGVVQPRGVDAGDGGAATGGASPGTTGLPDGLKAGIESLSGLSMDAVRVHRDSSRPARLGAVAFAQGTDIHLAPGQERHLPHEAWHVVQQAQGRVRPTRQLKAGEPLNDDLALEHEADRMGEEAVRLASHASGLTEAAGSAAPEPARPATAAAAAAGSVVQRDVGFEFEIGHSRIREAIDPAQAVPAAAYAAPAGLSQRLPKGPAGTWATSPGLEYQADDAGSESDVELVTTHFPETQAGRRDLETAVDAVAAFIGAYLAGHAVAHPQGRNVMPTDLVGIPGYAVTRPAAHFPAMQPTAKPQATVGLRLDRLRHLMAGAFPVTGETAAERLARDPNRQGLGVTSAAYAAAQQPLTHGMRIMQVLDRALTRAEVSVDAYIAAHRHAPPKTDRLVSLLALVYAYLDMGRSGLVRSYAKTIAPVMARTDFATLFSQLDPFNRDYFRNGDGSRWIDLVKTNSAYAWHNIGKAIYSGGIEQSQEPGEWFVDLSRKRWLTDMTKGVDRLTAAHFPTAEGRQQIEGLGGYRDAMDLTAGGDAAPIFELRAAPPLLLTSARDWALNVFDYVVALNAGNPYTFVAHPLPTPPILAPVVAPVLAAVAGHGGVGGGGGGGGGGGPAPVGGDDG